MITLLGHLSLHGFINEIFLKVGTLIYSYNDIIIVGVALVSRYSLITLLKHRKNFKADY